MKIKMLSLLTIVLLIVSNSVAKENFKSTNQDIKFSEPNTCENLAVDVYYATLSEGGTWQEANENFHNAYTSCCFSYPNDCEGMVILEP